MKKPPSIKMCCLGGGGRLWTVSLLKDLASSPLLSGEIALHDIDRAAARENAARAAVIFGLPGANPGFRVTVPASLEAALAGSDIVIISIQPGPAELMQSDLDVPLRYGIFQTVGDTTGPGGLLRALRAVPIFARFAAAIMSHCPRARVINFSNPLAVATAALFAAAPGINAFGACHEVHGTRKFLAELAREKSNPAPDPADSETPRAGDIELDIAGVNHFTFATAARCGDRDLFPLLRERLEEPGFFDDRSAIARERKAKGEYFVSDKRIAFDFLRRFNAFGAAGDRHLAEFVPWYLKSEEEIHRWGVILTPSSYRLARLRVPKPKDDPSLKKLESSGECLAELLAALSGGAERTVSLNLPNRGRLPGLPEEAIVETFARVTGRGARALPASPLPEALNALVARAAVVQKLTLEAALARDPDLAFQALLLDPLVSIPTDKARAMFREMLENTKAMLPGWTI